MSQSFPRHTNVSTAATAKFIAWSLQVVSVQAMQQLRDQACDAEPTSEKQPSDADKLVEETSGQATFRTELTGRDHIGAEHPLLDPAISQCLLSMGSGEQI